MQAVINLLKKSKAITQLMAICYNSFFNFGRGISSNIKNGGGFLRNVQFCVNKNSRVEIGPYTVMKNCKISISGRNSRIVIKGNGTFIANFSLCCEDDNSCIIIDEHTTMLGGEVASTEGCNIRIGKDCMFSANIDIRNGDSHTIYSIIDGTRINNASDIVIGNHVWLTRNVSVLKGAVIAANCVVGHSSVVSGVCDSENSVYAGIPARKMKGNINWKKPR